MRFVELKLALLISLTRRGHKWPRFHRDLLQKATAIQRSDSVFSWTKNFRQAQRRTARAAAKSLSQPSKGSSISCHLGAPKRLQR